jgi:phage-related holin
MPIGLVISVWVIITEAISIFENLEKIGVPVPNWLIRVLRKTHDKINKPEENKND